MRLGPATALKRQPSFLLVTFGLFLGLSLDMVESASCPAATFNASAVCEGVERNSVKKSPNLTQVVCDNFENLAQVNRTFIIRALEFGMRRTGEVPLNIVQVLINQVDEKELEAALEEFNRKIVNSSLISHRWKTTLLQALWDEKLRNEDRFNETAFVTSWFQERLWLFISAISGDMLQCLSNETMQCTQYQAIVKGLDGEFTNMSPQTQEDVFSSFQLPYLKGLNSNGSGCTEHLSDAMWLTANFGRFSRYANYEDFVALNSRFNGLDVLKNLTVTQLAQLSATGGALKTPGDVQALMEFIETSMLTEYIDEFNKQAHVNLPKEIQASLLEHVLVAAQPIFQEAGDAEFILWMERRLPVLISGLNSTHVPLLFDHLEPRNCSAISSVTDLLNGSIGEFNNATRWDIFEAIRSTIANSSLQCYAPNSSFAVFLEETFQGFAYLLTLRDLESLIPTSDLQEIVNTIPPDDLADLLSREGFLNADSFLTAVLQNYTRNGAFIDRFNEKGITDLLSNDTKTALLAGVWLTVVTSSSNTEVDLWLQDRLTHYFMFLDGNMMNASETLNASCATFHKIISKLSTEVEVFGRREEELYYSIKGYLMATEARPRCYNASDPETSNWLVTYLGDFISYSSARDMRLFTNYSAATFQDLALNPDNLEFISRTKMRKDLAEMYAAALFARDPEFSLDNLPDQLICFARHSAQISSLSPADALRIGSRINRFCSAPQPSASGRQLAMMLVAQIKTFDGQTLVALGQQAVGLTTAQISNITAQDLVDPRVLESLGQVNGWNRGQSQALVNKILHRNFRLDTAEAFERLGTLVQALPSNGFDSISADLAIELGKTTSFLDALRAAPESVKKAFVDKILSNSSSPSDILNNVPEDLVDQVPNSLLRFQGNITDLHKINEKRWSPQQVAVFFGEVLASTDNYTELSPFVLQGLQCNAASKLTPGQLSSLTREVKVKNANLSADQLSCMARLLTRSNLMANFSSYSPDVLLFFPLDQVKDLDCKAFYTVASQGDLSLLANGSAQRTHLLENALSCFGVGNASLSKEQLQALGAFVCDMGAATIGFSDPSILENLKRCPDLTASQKTTLNTLLSSGKTSSGAPQSWDEETFEDLGPLALYINRTTWGSINQEERTIFLRNVAEGYGSQSASQREKTLLFLTEVGPNPASSPRRKRATESCQSTPITASTLEDDLLILQYDSAQQFDACLSNEVLRDNLASLLDQPLPNDYLLVIKRKLDEIYNGEIPEDQLALLGYLSRLYSADEIGGWNVTSSDTLTALLNRNNGAWEPAQLRRLVGRYLELGGTLTGPLLDVLEGPYLCLLDEDQLQQISPEAIAHAGKLDLSSCSQGKKDILYQKAHTAFASQEGTDAYYPLIQPYLGGAPVEDLKALAASKVAMDINTFINLNPEELKELSVQDVRGLLGIHLPDLKEVENHTSVAMWIRAQLQSDLDTLGIGLQGGMMTPSSTEASSTAVGAPIASGPPSADASVTPTMGSTLSAPSSTASLGFKATTVTTIGIVPSADFPTSLTAASSKVTATSEETTTRSPATEADVNMTTPGETTLDSSTATSNTVALPLVPVLSNVTSTSNETTTRSPATTSDFSTMAPGEITVESNTTALPSILMDSTTAVPNTLIPVFSNVTSTSNETTTRAPATTSDFSTMAPGEITVESNTTALPPILMDSTTAVPTTLIPVFSNVTSTSNETTTRPPATVTDFNMTTPGEITLDSSTTTSNTVALPLVPVLSNVTSTSNETTTQSPATETGTSAKTAEAPSTTVTDNTPLPATTADTNTTFATGATISLTSTIGMHHTLHANETTSSTNVTRATMPGLPTMPSKGPSAPLKPMPNATSPAPISKATEVIDRSPTTSSTSTVHAPETFHKTDVPPGSVPTQKTTLTPTETRRTTSRKPAAATPPSHPTPNGYINVQPLSGSASKPALHWLFMTLTITAVISVLRMCL